MTSSRAGDSLRLEIFAPIEAGRVGAVITWDDVQTKSQQGNDVYARRINCILP